jgi:hypothetical protein
VAGYVGRLLMPGRDEMGFIATMPLGLYRLALKDKEHPLAR